LTLWILGCIQFTLVVAQWMTGRVADAWGIETAYLLPNLFLVICAVALAVYLRFEAAHTSRS